MPDFNYGEFDVIKSQAGIPPHSQQVPGVSEDCQRSVEARKEKTASYSFPSLPLKSTYILAIYCKSKQSGSKGQKKPLKIVTYVIQSKCTQCLQEVGSRGVHHSHTSNVLHCLKADRLRRRKANTHSGGQSPFAKACGYALLNEL